MENNVDSSMILAEMADANWFCASFDNFSKVVKAESHIHHG
jgi:hypothetical protein